VHAELIQRDAQWFLRNRSKTNPARLDKAIVIGERPLHNGCTIELGSVVLRFEEQVPVAGEDEDVPRTVAYGDVAREPIATRPDHQGRLRDGEAVDIVAMYGSARRTGRLVLLEQDGVELSIWYHNGEIVGAKSGNSVGRAAAMQLAVRSFATYRFHVDEQWDGARISGGTAGILMDLARAIDHANRRKTR
jgi:hypothetical protein